ncbi:MAG: ubiquinone/menaquinone biosynthesis methyltransferase [Candidatus Omnitrophota bacterium]|nr:ubiquinone/menaquinone biosynthesis methyltransferase [Candidatus Omnitrophota bacterium]
MTSVQLKPRETVSMTLPADAGTGEKRVFIRRLFTDIAPRYDWFNRLASAGLDQRWRRETVRRSGIGPGQRVLDVCAGTGDLTLLCAERLQGQGLVVGLDFTSAMLSWARRKQQARGLSVNWLQGDALSLPFADDSFDRVMIGFSTRNLADVSAGLREMVRVLRSQGQLMILETGYPSNPLLRAGYHAFLLTVARMIGFLLTGRCWPFTYLARSVQQFLTPRAFVERLRGAGTVATYVPLSGGLASLYLGTKP